MLYYIYKITNKINNKCYIGLTNNVKRRRLRHFTDLRCGVHDNDFLLREFSEYGEENFSFETLLEKDCSDQEISKLEQEYIVKFDSYRNGYNQNEGGNFRAANGGTQLTHSDIYNICAALEFMSRPGQILGDMFSVTRTTISRIKQGVNHNEAINKYKAMPLEQRQAIYKIFCDSTNFIEDKVNTTIIVAKRFLTEEQVHLILLNEELGRKQTLAEMTRRLGVKSDNTLYCILKGNSYKDYALTYTKLSEKEKEKLASLLSNE